MARQEIILGTPPLGLGGDTPRVANSKINAMTSELYQGIGTPTSPLPVSKGGTGGNSQATAQAGLGLVPAAVTATASDYPSGILKTGHAGWNGGAAIVIGNGANCDTLVNAFLYALNGTFTNGPPSFGSAAFFLRVSVHGVGYESQEAFGITHGGRAERRRINGVWQPWSNIYNGVNATLDPSGTGGGLMSSAIFGNYLVSKYANGEMNIRGVAPMTSNFTVGEIRVVTVALPVTLVNSGLGYLYKSTTNAQPQQTYDFYGVIAEYMSDANTAAFVIRNGGTAQAFVPTINVWGRWK
ncbi:hypothetical protein HRH33_13190 [Pseudomonas rhodesiae]|uniref:pyocin knob domain-containing protein n=1 Tax=Pseudomonas rhodesiae TaxID=76760 RepID=UPI00156AF871|nr:pyocin knob domain-containing protein [Pseudomonas rhodesiae]QKJ73493.1 hypothetical protein HRH33_13190 [Pseudomonas rhodesiae]